MNLKIFLLSACTMVNAASGEASGRIELGTAGNFVILAKTGISTVPKSVVTGDIGVSPIFSPAITGFNLAMHTSGTYSTDRDIDGKQLTGKAFAPDYIVAPDHIDTDHHTDTDTDDHIDTDDKLTTAVGDMQTAYTDAAGRSTTDANLNLQGGLIGGLTLTPGVYTFAVDVKITGDIYLDSLGDADAVFIIQTAGNIIQDANTKVILTDSATTPATAAKVTTKAGKIFWQVAGAVTVGAGAHLEGILLVKTGVTFVTGSTLNGRILAQTRVDLQKATITTETTRRGLRGLQVA